MSRFFNEALSALDAYIPGEQPQGDTLIKLNTNELPYPPSPAAAKAAAEAARRLNLYPDPAAAEFTCAVAHWLDKGPENVMVTNGSDESLAFVFQGLCAGGVAFADVTYGFYSVLAQLYRLETDLVPLRGDFSLDPQDYAGTRRAVVVSNPNSPTGLALERNEIEQLLRQNPDRLVVVDEAYAAFAGDVSAVPLIEQYGNLVVVGTFSKSHGLAGARLGYAAARPELIADLMRIKFSFNPYSVNRMSLAAGTAALRDIGYFRACRDKVVATRESAIRALRALGFDCTDSRANFLFVRHPEIPAQVLYKRLRQEGILVRWFDQPRIREFLRVTVGTADDMAVLAQKLKQIIENR